MAMLFIAGLFVYIRSKEGVSWREMASDDERAQLLDSDDGETSTSELRRRKIPSVRGVTDVIVDGSRFLEDDSTTVLSVEPNTLQTVGDSDYVVAVFVVAFDTKAGSSNEANEVLLRG